MDKLTKEKLMKKYNIREIAGKEKDTYRWINKDDHIVFIEDQVIKDIVKIVEENK